MKGLYIQTLYLMNELRNDTEIGVARKISYQIRFFEENNIHMDMYNPFINRNRLVDKIERRLPFQLSSPERETIEFATSYDFIYIRNPKLMDGSLFLLLKRLKKRNPSIIILVEVPTFPYEHEMKDLRNIAKLPLIYNDKNIRKKFNCCVDRVVTYSNDSIIWGVPTIKISNAINYRESCRKKIMCELKDSTIEIIACAQLCFWHGYDRAIKGLSDYYKRKEQDRIRILLHIVGNGDELKNYKAIVSENHLEEWVIFHGSLHGDALDQIYDRCVIGLDSMGRHRSGVYYNSSLKSKEYLARGLMVISGVSTELDYDESFKYYMRIPADDSNLDFTVVVEWFNNLMQQESLDLIQTKIMDYAEKKFDYSVAMKPVLTFIKERDQIMSENDGGGGICKLIFVLLYGIVSFTGTVKDNWEYFSYIEILLLVAPCSHNSVEGGMCA